MEWFYAKSIIKKQFFQIWLPRVVVRWKGIKICFLYFFWYLHWKEEKNKNRYLQDSYFRILWTQMFKNLFLDFQILFLKGKRGQIVLLHFLWHHNGRKKKKIIVKLSFQNTALVTHFSQRKGRGRGPFAVKMKTLEDNLHLTSATVNVLVCCPNRVV